MKTSTIPNDTCTCPFDAPAFVAEDPAPAVSDTYFDPAEVLATAAPFDAGKLLADIKDGETFTNSFVILRACEVKTTKTGSPYLMCSVMDKSATLSAKKWAYFGSAADYDNVVCAISGKGQLYNGAMQVVIENIRRANDYEANAARDHLVPATDDFRFETDKNDVHRMIEEHVTDPDYSRVCSYFISTTWDRFIQAPAADKVHHAFVHGLLMHTANIMRVASYVADVYELSGLHVDKSLLLTGAFMHDMGKLQEYALSDLGLVEDYSTVGRLIGHPVLSAIQMTDICRELGIPDAKAVLLVHLMLSHHGKLEWGSPVLPLCVEAEILSKLDLLDATLEQFRGVQNKTEPGTFAAKEFFLDNRRIFVHSEATDSTEL